MRLFCFAAARITWLAARAGWLLFFAWAASGAELRTAEAVRRMSPDEAAQGVPVRLTGVVTFYNDLLHSRFIQDSTAGIYLQMTNSQSLAEGQVIEIQGVTSPGEYAPVVIPTNFQVIGHAPLPQAPPVSIEQLVSGAQDSQFVQASGIVRSVHFEAESEHYLIDLVSAGERFTAYARELPLREPDQLLDSMVTVRGVCATLFNRQRQLFGFRLLIPRGTDLVVDKPAPAQPFDIPEQDISSLLQFTSRGSFGHRVKVAGTVVYHESGVALFVQDDTEGLYCQTPQRTPVHPGDRVEVLGFPAKGEYNPVLQDAVYRKVGTGHTPEAVPIGPDVALAGTHDCRLVRIEANLLEQTQRGREQFLVLERDRFIFHAFLAQDFSQSGFAAIQNGSRVSVTGICLIERGSNWRAGESWRAKSFRLLLRSPRDVSVLRSPPWWTLQRVLWAAGALALVAVAALAWIAVLRHRVHKQTEIIRERLQTEATLKERYEDLFENANDMVLTHNLAGQIISINKTGERVLQRTRQSILATNLIDLIAPDQRAAAQVWLEQVVRGADLPTAEWDFLNASGQRVKLEISSRLIAEDGRAVEVEGIARDITERRRLEREILEISNREQRRIGHDLHDGVCQQLAAISYLADILGDQLRDRSSPESGEAERIGRLVNEANAQARNVARYLFPVRLEEHGLHFALEELAANAAHRYRITCRFVSPNPPAKVDPEMELHLYYIAQEALLNAVNHGKATSVIISLAPEGDRFKLVVQDNGIGFNTSDKSRAGMGIRIMRYRARVVGAALELRSQPGQGSELTCIFNPSARDSIQANRHERSTI